MKTRITARTTACAIIVSLPLTATANARNWFVLNHITNQCVPAEQFPDTGSSPAVAVAILRSGGIVPDVKIQKDDSLGTSVEIIFMLNDTPVEMDYFTSIDTCKTIVSTLQEEGSLPNPDDLR